MPRARDLHDDPYHDQSGSEPATHRSRKEFRCAEKAPTVTRKART